MRYSVTIVAAMGLLVAAYFHVAPAFSGPVMTPEKRATLAQNTAAATSPVVVELYTSQGCYSCPPADAFLGELAKESNVVALSLHIDYWDYIGWKDPYALPGNSQRQRHYSRYLDRRYVYTPQMVIDGTYDVVGSQGDEVLAKIAKASQAEGRVQVEIDWQAGKAIVPAGEAPEEGATVYLAVYDDKHVTDIKRGENGGKTLAYYNVVRDLQSLGTWNGERMEITLDLDALRAQGQGGCAIIVQTGTHGRILGAADMKFPGGQG